MAVTQFRLGNQCQMAGTSFQELQDLAKKPNKRQLQAVELWLVLALMQVLVPLG